MSWTTVKLSDLATVSSGGSAPQDPGAFTSVGIPFIRAGSLIKLLEGLPERQLELLKPEIAAAHNLKLYPKGSVVFAKSGMSATKGYIYQLKEPAYVVNHLAVLTPNSEISGKYLRHVLRFKSPTCLIKDDAYPSIRLGEIEEMEVPAPMDVAERERIVSILDEADELRRKRQRAINRLNQLGEAIFHEMFGDPSTNPMGWPQASLAEICEINPRYRSNLSDDEPVSFLPMASVSETGFVIEEKERRFGDVKKGFTSFERGDVLLAKITPCFENGKSCKTDDITHNVGFASTEFHVIRPSEFMNADLLFHIIHRDKFIDLGKLNMTGSAGQKRVPAGFLRDYSVSIPSRDLQSDFSKIVGVIDSIKDSVNSSLLNSEKVFRAIQHSAFRGSL
jgi:type I restriction enzyme S subunit